MATCEVFFSYKLGNKVYPANSRFVLPYCETLEAVWKLLPEEINKMLTKYYNVKQNYGVSVYSLAQLKEENS